MLRFVHVRACIHVHRMSDASERAQGCTHTNTFAQLPYVWLHKHARTHILYASPRVGALRDSSDRRAKERSRAQAHAGIRETRAGPVNVHFVCVRVSVPRSVNEGFD